VPKVSDAYREDQRRRILDAASTCFAAKGFRGTSMADIVSESGLSPGAIYGYFEGKGEIVAAIAEERHAYEESLVSTALGHEDLREGLKDLVRAYFDWLKDPKERQRRILTIQVWAESFHDEALRSTTTRGAPQREAIRRALEQAKRRRQLPKRVDPDALSRLILAVLQGFVLQQAWEPDIDVDAYARTAQEVIDALLGG
jgi:AcrR family transcriptional regulator